MWSRLVLFLKYMGNVLLCFLLSFIFSQDPPSEGLLSQMYEIVSLECSVRTSVTLENGIKEDVHDWKLIIKLRKLLPLVSSDCKLRSFVPAQFYVAFLSQFPINLLLPSVFARAQCCSVVLCSECKAGIGVACLRETWPQLLGSVCAQQHGDGITELLVLFVSLCTWREQI